jgi:CSLREA domain-containing protein
MFFVTTAHTANAGTNIWTTHGPPGGQVTAPAIDPTKPTALYAATFADVVFKSTDSGSSSSAVNIGLTRPGVSSLAIDPSTPSTLDAGTTITVQTTAGGTGGPDCTLRDAITAANEDKATGGCVAGTGADTIVLDAGATYVLTTVDNDMGALGGPNGLPVIASDIQIDGNGARIERSREAPEEQTESWAS